MLNYCNAYSADFVAERLDVYILSASRDSDRCAMHVSVGFAVVALHTRLHKSVLRFTNLLELPSTPCAEDTWKQLRVLHDIHTYYSSTAPNLP